MKNNVTFEDIQFLFEEYSCYCSNPELHWYHYMWSILGKNGLTQYEDEFEYCTVLCRAVTLIYMYYGFISALDCVETYPCDIYDSCLCNEIPEFVLGQMFGKEEDEYSEDKSYAIFVIAKKQFGLVNNAIANEMSLEELLKTMCAVFYEEAIIETDEDGEEYEELWKIESYSDYLDIVTNRLEKVDYEIYGCCPANAYILVVINQDYFWYQ